MKTNDFIVQSINTMVYVTGRGDLAFSGEIKPLIHNKTPLRLLKLTKAGLAYLHDEVTNKYYSVPPTNIREVGT